MTKQAFNWDPSLLRRGPRPHSTWAIKVESAHRHYSGSWADEQGESVDLDQLPIVIANRLEQVVQLRHLEEQVAELAQRLDEMEETLSNLSNQTVTIQTFAPEPYSLSSPISVVIEGDGDGGFIASFYDANISSAGDNAQEAFENLKSLILDTFDSLSQEAPSKLGPEPLRQLAVLRSFISAA